MKLPAKTVPTNEQIIQILSKELPQYRYSVRLGKFVDVKQGFFVGASVIPKKDGVIVNGNFPSPGASMSFTLILLGTGILIGLILWLAVWRGGQNVVRDEVVRALQPRLTG
jgi:hypothetical protein